MRARRSLGVGLSVALAAALCGVLAAAQSREPLCVTVEARRLVSGPYLQANGSDTVVALPLPGVGADGAVFVVAARDPDHTLRVGDARGLPRSLAELGYTGEHTEDRAPGLTVLRVARDLSVVGAGVFIPDPVRGERGEETYPPGIPAGATVDGGVLLVEHIAGDLYATVVPATGEVPAVHRVAEAPTPERAGVHRGYVWLTVGPRPGSTGSTGSTGGAVALAGTDDGQVVALAFDRAGATVGAPVYWSQRVGGAMHRVGTPTGVGMVAVLERPVRGTTVTGAQAREQVLVRLTDGLEPTGEPERLGLGPYETAAAVQGQRVVLTQWAESRGLAVSGLEARDGALTVGLPRIWTTQAFEGVALGHSLVRVRGNVLWDVMLHGDDVAGGLHGYLTFVPPAGVPVVRRDVLPLRARVIAPPALLPADDGVVAVMAEYDEAGGGIDAVHVRCEMVTLPARQP